MISSTVPVGLPTTTEGTIFYRLILLESMIGNESTGST